MIYVWASNTFSVVEDWEELNQFKHQPFYIRDAEKYYWYYHEPADNWFIAALNDLPTEFRTYLLIEGISV